MPVEIAVRVVVDHAAGGAHQVHAEDEDQQVLQAGLALTGYPQGPERWPQQQIDADGLVQPGQLDEVHGAGMQAVQRLK
ncbi:hypothetical protein D9M69_498600 [compost metagenome]